MRSAFAKPNLPLEQAFMKRTSSLYSAMKQRFSERRFKSGPRKGVIFRAGIPLPFDLEEFRQFVLECLGGNQNGAGQCHYCRCALDALNIGFDHEQPIKQGGSIGLINLKPACSSCNKFKGSLSPMAFAWLKGMLVSEVGKHLTLADSREIVMRLKSGGGAYKTSKKAKDLAAKAKAVESDEPF